MNSPTRSRTRKLWLLVLPTVLVAGVALCEWKGWPFLQRPLESILAGRLHRQVEFGNPFSLRLLGSIRLDTASLRVGPPGHAGADSPLGGDLVDARDLQLRIPWSTVAGIVGHSGQAPNIRSLRVGSMNMSLKRLADGTANWTLSAKAPSKSNALPQVGELVVGHGRLRVDDAVSRTAIDARISTREGAIADAHAAAHADAQVQDGERSTAGLVIDGDGRWHDKSFRFHLASPGVLPLLASGKGPAVPLSVDVQAHESRFDFKGRATDVMRLNALEGQARLQGPSLAAVGAALGLTLPATPAFQLDGRLAKHDQEWLLNDAQLQLGHSRLGGQFKLDRRSAVPDLSGTLDGQRLVLADLAPAFGAAPPQGANHAKPQRERVLPARQFHTEALHHMNAHLQVKLASADLGRVFREPLAPLDGTLSLQDGVLSLSHLVARAAGGELRGTIRIDASRTREPDWTADLNWSGIQLGQWLSPRDTASRKRKPSGDAPGYVSGRLGGQAQLRAAGDSTAAMLASLDGDVQAWVSDGRISHLLVEAAGLDIAQGLGVLVEGDDPLVMNCAVVKAVAKDGRVTPEVAIVDTKDSTLFASGNVSLASERLDLKLTARPKDVSPATLRSPVRVEGTFGHPKVTLEKKRIGLKLLASAALAAVNPLAALIPLFDTGDKAAAHACRKTLSTLRGPS